MIRTLVEIRNGRVSIQENADETTVTVTVDGAQSETDGLNHGTVLTLKQSLEQKTNRISALENRITNLLEDRELLRGRVEGLEAELISIKRAHVCTASCRPNAHVAFTGNQRLKELESEVQRLKEDRELDLQTITEQRAELDRLKEGRTADHEEIVALRGHVDRAESELERRTEERDEREAARATLERENAWLHRVVQQANLRVHGPEILEALGQDPNDISPAYVARLANAVREVRQIVTAPRPETSQA